MAKSYLSTSRDYRAKWYLLVDKSGESVRSACHFFNISRKTYYKWHFRDFGPSDHRYLAKRTQPQTKLMSDVKLIIYEAKLKYNYGPKKMQLYLADNHKLYVSTTIIYRYFKKRNLIRHPRRTLPWYTPLTNPYYSLCPGDNVPADIKYVPNPREVNTWDYQFRFIDTYTNMQYSVNCEDKSAHSTISAFKQAQKYFPFTIKGIQTDNGGEFRGLFAIYLKSKGIIHRFRPKRSAPWNGQVERANRSVDDEYYLNPTKPWLTLSQYVHWYNFERYHLGKNMFGLTPYQKYQNYVSLISKVSPLSVN